MSELKKSEIIVGHNFSKKSKIIFLSPLPCYLKNIASVQWAPHAVHSAFRSSVGARNSNLRERLCTVDLLIKIACFVRE